jgi:hypothetical protein
MQTLFINHARYEETFANQSSRRIFVGYARWFAHVYMAARSSEKAFTTPAFVFA